MQPLCPECNGALVEIGAYFICESHGQVQPQPGEPDDPLWGIASGLPFPLAVVIREYLAEHDTFARLWRLVDTAEVLTRFAATVALAEVRREADALPEVLQAKVGKAIERPTFGAWRMTLESALQASSRLHSSGQAPVVPELAGWCENHLLVALGGQRDSPERAVLALRNQLAHAVRRGELAPLLDAHVATFRLLLESSTWLERYELAAVVGVSPHLVSLTGLPDATGRFPAASMPANAAMGSVLLRPRDGDDHRPELNLYPLQVFASGSEVGGSAPVGAAQIYQRFDSTKRRAEFTVFTGAVASVSHEGVVAQRLVRDLGLLKRRRKELTPLEGGTPPEVGADFVGRHDELEVLRAAIDAHDSGLLWLYGTAGSGKSWLAAKMVEEYREKADGNVVVPYFFRAGEEGCSIDSFLASATRRLAAFAPAEADPDARVELLKRLRAAASTSGAKVLVVVDGLDELGRAQPDIFRMALAMSLPRVVWLCVSRPGTVAAAAGAVKVFDRGLGPMTDEGIRAMLTAGLDRLRYDLFGQDVGDHNRFVDVVTRRSNGLPSTCACWWRICGPAASPCRSPTSSPTASPPIATCCCATSGSLTSRL